jgi:uncharacterized cofD-like protein
MKNVTAIGGGHGLSMLLRTLLPCDVSLTAIVSVADDGGSSGRLRHDLDIVAPGDIRSCLLALAEKPASPEAEMLKKVFDYRFDQGELDGHSLGNLILVALARELGSFEAAVDCASELLNINGRVLPATESSVVLCAQTGAGLVRGQVEIEHTSDIERVFLDPDTALPLAGVVDAILNADHVIYAPGSLFTSVIPAFIIPEIAHALKMTSADVTMIMNLINRGPDTEGLSGDDHLRKVLDHGGRVDRVICDWKSLMVKQPGAGIDVVVEMLSDGTDSHDPELLRAVLISQLNL